MSNFKDNSGLDVIKPKMSQEERDRLMKEFLEKGNKIQKLKPGYPINVGSLDKSKKPRYSKEEIEKGITGTAELPDYKSYKEGTYHDFDVGGDKIPVYEPIKREPEKKGGK
jgi:hypothetical protein